MNGSTSALIAGVLTVFLSIVTFGWIAGRMTSGQTVAQVEAPAAAPKAADAPPAPPARSEQPGVAPSEVKPDQKQADPAVTAPASKQPADPVNPDGNAKMPDAEPKQVPAPQR